MADGSQPLIGPKLAIKLTSIVSQWQVDGKSIASRWQIDGTLTVNRENFN